MKYGWASVAQTISADHPHCVVSASPASALMTSRGPEVLRGPALGASFGVSMGASMSVSLGASFGLFGSLQLIQLWRSKQRQ